MNFRRLIATLLVAIMCFSLSFCNLKEALLKGDTEENETQAGERETEAEETETETEADETEGDGTESDEADTESESVSRPLLYKVTDGKGNTVWLFGSIHVGREDYYPLPDYVLDAFDGSDALAVECDVVSFEKDISRQTKVLSYLMYKDGSTIEQHVPPNLLKRSTELLKEYDLYISGLEQFKPILWDAFIDQALAEECGGDSELGVDLHLMNRADKADKTLYEVESVEFQYRMMADFSPELQTRLLYETVVAADDMDVYKAELTEMMDIWASGDEEAFVEYLTADTSALTDKEKVLYEEYNTAMVIERNISMAIYAEEALKSGEEVFICVGAAHVVGEGAIADLMAERGYTVELVN